MNPQNAVHVPKSRIDEAIAMPPKQGKTELEPFKSLMKSLGVPFFILEDTQVENNKVELHTHEADVWMCLEGESWFKLGGEMVDPFPSASNGAPNSKEMRSYELRDAETVVMKPGDWLWIPAGVPHQHGSTGTARLMIFKIPNKDA